MSFHETSSSPFVYPSKLSLKDGKATSHFLLPIFIPYVHRHLNKTSSLGKPDYLQTQSILSNRSDDRLKGTHKSVIRCPELEWTKVHKESLVKLRKKGLTFCENHIFYLHTTHDLMHSICIVSSHPYFKEEESLARANNCIVSVKSGTH